MSLWLRLRLSTDTRRYLCFWKLLTYTYRLTAFLFVMYWWWKLRFIKVNSVYPWWDSSWTLSLIMSDFSTCSSFTLINRTWWGLLKLRNQVVALIVNVLKVFHVNLLFSQLWYVAFHLPKISVRWLRVNSLIFLINVSCSPLHDWRHLRLLRHYIGPNLWRSVQLRR